MCINVQDNESFTQGCSTGGSLHSLILMYNVVNFCKSGSRISVPIQKDKFKDACCNLHNVFTIG